jgi:hypothetical protein
MTRGHLLSLSLKPAVPARRGDVWRMTMIVIGQAFGVRSALDAENRK